MVTEATTLQKVSKDIEYLKNKVQNMEKDIKELKSLEFESLTKDELMFFNKVYGETKKTDFWLTEKDLEKNGIKL